MNLPLESLLSGFDDLSLREQLLIGAAGLAAAVFLLQTLMIDPLTAEKSRVSARLVTLETVQSGLEQSLATAKETGASAREKAMLAEQQRLKVEVGVIDAQLEEYAASLVPPDEMREIVEVLLADRSLRVVSFKNERPILLSAGQSGSEDHDSLFRHGLTISVRGDYFSVVDFLRSLEKQKWRFLWQKMVYKVIDYPEAQVDLELQTLSAESRWLDV